MTCSSQKKYARHAAVAPCQPMDVGIFSFFPLRYQTDTIRLPLIYKNLPPRETPTTENIIKLW